jgi:SAM-dependent methyltransferase
MSPNIQPGSMLEYYVSNGISPVHQDISDLFAHLDRRQSLYQSIGLLPSAFRDRTVLEVGPGSGHNSLFIACQAPSRYVLLEPNPLAVSEIQRLYSTLTRAHTAPEIIRQKLEDFPGAETFDVVICEGWLGSSLHEQAMVTKLSRHVRDGGVLVLTVISPLGLVANTIRKALCLKLTAPHEPIENRIDIGLEAFSPHLKTLSNMTTPHRDWLLDMVLSPVFFDICLTPEMAVARLGPRFEALGTQPRFIADWRWYKSIYGNGRDFNSQMLASYRANVLNFLDYNLSIDPISESVVTPLMRAAENLLASTAKWEREYGALGTEPPKAIFSALQTLTDGLRPYVPNVTAAIDEACLLLKKKTLRPMDVANMKHFTPIFGRELIYCSFYHNAKIFK